MGGHRCGSCLCTTRSYDGVAMRSFDSDTKQQEAPRNRYVQRRRVCRDRCDDGGDTSGPRCRYLAAGPPSASSCSSV